MRFQSSSDTVVWVGELLHPSWLGCSSAASLRTLTVGVAALLTGWTLGFCACKVPWGHTGWLEEGIALASVRLAHEKERCPQVKARRSVVLPRGWMWQRSQDPRVAFQSCVFRQLVDLSSLSVALPVLIKCGYRCPFSPFSVHCCRVLFPAGDKEWRQLWGTPASPDCSSPPSAVPWMLASGMSWPRRSWMSTG